MYTHATIIIGDDPNKTLHVARALIDTGAHGGNYIGRKFLTANRDFLHPLIKSSDTSVFLADGITELKIDESLDLSLVITAYTDRLVSIRANFCVIEAGCDLILGLNDLILQAGDFLVNMVQRAVAFGRGEQLHAAESLPPTVAPGVLQSVARPHPSLPFCPTTTPSHDPHRPSARPSERRERGESWRARTLAHTITTQAVAGGAQAVQSLPMLPSEPGQDLRRPWSQLLDRGPEEDETPFHSMFGDVPSDEPSLHFMETSVEVARAEYLAEIDMPQTTSVPSSTKPDKQPKRGRFAPGMCDIPGFLTFLREVAIDIFVPTNWTGIKVDPIEFKFKPDMEQSFRAKARPISPLRLKLVHDELMRLCKYHLVPSTSSWVSAMSDADKATAPFVRLCGDYRKLNENVAIEHQHIPLVRHELERFARFRFFVDLDMANSFHQFPLANKTSNLLSIITPWGTFRPVFMPEGVSPASGVLQAAMRKIFEDFSEWCVVIFDNFCIGGDSLEDVFEKFKLFVARCILYNIVLKFGKCYFGWRDVKFFGFLCDGEGYQIDDDRKAAIRAIPFPSGPTPKICTTRMQAFLGFSLYFSYFVPDYSTLAAPFYDMTVKGFAWDESTWILIDYRVLFDAFKELLCNAFKLIYPDWDLPWILQPDASKVGVGAILFQVRTITDAVTGEVTQRREPIACISYKFSGSAVDWAVIKQEMYAIYWAVDKLAYYLRYKPFQIQTDHSNLLQMEKSVIAIIVRWRICLQGYPILSIIHLAGKVNIAADFLSRVHECDYDKLTESDKKQLACLSAALLAHMPSAEKVIDELEGFSPKQQLQFIVSRVRSMFCERSDDVRDTCDDSYCIGCGDNYAQLCAIDPVIDTTRDIIVDMTRRKLEPDVFTERVPEWDAIIAQFHSGVALHWGATRTWRLMQESIIHKIPFAYIAFYVRECATCQKFRKTLTSYRVDPVVRHLKVANSRSTLGMDGFSLTPPDVHGNNYMHVVVNQFTKHTFLFVSKDKTAQSGADAVITYMALFGRHNGIQTDPGADYTAKVVEELNKYLGYSHRFSLVDRHESNGVEPTNREIKRHVQALVFDLAMANRWSEPRILALITYEINRHRSSESGYSAFDLLYGSQSGEYFKNLGAESIEPVEKYSSYIRALDADITNLRKLSSEFQFKLAEMRATDPSKPRNHWQPGDLVLLDNLNPKNKLQAPRLGPYKVDKHVQNKNEVFLKNLVDGEVKPFYVGRLSLYTGSYEEALKGARADRDQHLIECFSGYRGDVDIRETLEFRVEFTDGEKVWKRFDQDLAGTAQMESYCQSLPQLEPLLSLATEVAKRKSELSKKLVADTHREGAVIFVDLRARRLYESEYYLQLELEDKDIRPRYVKLVVGKTVAVPNTKKGSRVELIDPTFGLAHRVDPYFLHVHGTVRSVEDLPANSEVIDAAFAQAHPYNPINAVLHRRLARRDLAVVAAATEKMRLWSCNVNGISSALSKGMLQQLKELPGGMPDLVLMQETKSNAMEESRLERIFASAGLPYFCMVPGAQSQHGGVAIASKTKIVILGSVPVERGRGMSIRVEGLIVTNLYAPIVCNNQAEMLQRRTEFDDGALAWLRQLPEPQLVCGDFNAVTDRAIDLELPARMASNFIGFQTNGEQRFQAELQAMGFKDTFRTLYPFERAFTCFPHGSWTKMRARLDYIMASSVTMDLVLDCRVMPKTPISDHAAVMLTIAKPSDPGFWPDFSKVLGKPLEMWEWWMGRSSKPVPTPAPSVTQVYMVRSAQTSAQASGAPPPPPPPPPPATSKGPPDEAQRKLTAEELAELEADALFHAQVLEIEARQAAEEAAASKASPPAPPRNVPNLATPVATVPRMSRDERDAQRARARRWADAEFPAQRSTAAAALGVLGDYRSLIAPSPAHATIHQPTPPVGMMVTRDLRTGATTVTPTYDAVEVLISDHNRRRRALVASTLNSPPQTRADQHGPPPSPPPPSFLGEGANYRPRQFEVSNDFGDIHHQFRPADRRPIPSPQTFVAASRDDVWAIGSNRTALLAAQRRLRTAAENLSFHDARQWVPVTDAHGITTMERMPDLISAPHTPVISNDWGDAFHQFRPAAQRGVATNNYDEKRRDEDLPIIYFQIDHPPTTPRSRPTATTFAARARLPIMSPADYQRRDAQRALARTAQREFDDTAAQMQLERYQSDVLARSDRPENQYTSIRQRERRERFAAEDADYARAVERRVTREAARVAAEADDQIKAAARIVHAAAYAQLVAASRFDPINRHRLSAVDYELLQREHDMIHAAANAPDAGDASAQRSPPAQVPDPFSTPQRTPLGAVRPVEPSDDSTPAEFSRLSVQGHDPSVDSRQSVYEGGTPQRLVAQSVASTASPTSAVQSTPVAAQPESPLTVDPPRQDGHFDYRYAINVTPVNEGGDMDPAGLAVRRSVYWGMSDGEIVDNVGDALVALVPIAPGTRIATFRGVVITRQQAHDIPEGENNYLISLLDDMVLDCMENARARPPRCLASLANQADSLYDQVALRFLNYDNNNAYVVWIRLDGAMHATLYAVRQIAEGEEIMWNYGSSFANGFDSDTVLSTSSGEPSFEDSEDESGSCILSADPLASAQPQGARLRVRAVRQRLRAAGFTHGEDAFPEYAFSNASPSSGSLPTSSTASAASRVSTPSPPQSPQPAATEVEITPPSARVQVQQRRRILPIRLLPSGPSEDKEDDVTSAKKGPS